MAQTKPTGKGSLFSHAHMDGEQIVDLVVEHQEANVELLSLKVAIACPHNKPGRGKFQSISEQIPRGSN